MHMLSCLLSKILKHDCFPVQTFDFFIFSQVWPPGEGFEALKSFMFQVRCYVFEIPMKTQDSDSKMSKFVQSLSLSCWYIWDRLNFTLESPRFQRSQVRRWTRCASAQRHGLWWLLKIAPATFGGCKEKPQRMHLKKLEKRPQHAATM